MHLNSSYEKLLRGEGGEARQLAMEILTKLGLIARIKGDAAEVVLAG